jgi:uncharacterized protein (DUF1330 family)
MPAAAVASGSAANYNLTAQGGNRMSVYVIVQGKVKDRGLLRQYGEKVGSTIAVHQGRVIAFDEEPEVVEGQLDLPRTVILEFPSKEAFEA